VLVWRNTTATAPFRPGVTVKVFSGSVKERPSANGASNQSP